MNMYFKQDGAPTHFANKTIQLLKKKFNGPAIYRNGDSPPISPDLAPIFFDVT